MEHVKESHCKETPGLGLSSDELTAKMEPFDSFWEGPANIEKGYASFFKFYKANYGKYLPVDRQAHILVISCGPGYFLNVLRHEGYQNIQGIDSGSDKVAYAVQKGLPAQEERAFEYLDAHKRMFDVIVCEQELNHLTKTEMVVFLNLCWESLKSEGNLVVHGLNGANPITGSEALAQNFDHYNTFTEYTFRQVLEYCAFRNIKVFPLNLYVFYWNPLNYVLWGLDKIYSLFFTCSFMMYGKANRLWTKKIAAMCQK